MHVLIHPPRCLRTHERARGRQDCHVGPSRTGHQQAGPMDGDGSPCLPPWGRDTGAAPRDGSPRLGPINVTAMPRGLWRGRFSRDRSKWLLVPRRRRTVRHFFSGCPYHTRGGKFEAGSGFDSVAVLEKPLHPRSVSPGPLLGRHASRELDLSCSDTCTSTHKWDCL